MRKASVTRTPGINLVSSTGSSIRLDCSAAGAGPYRWTRRRDGAVLGTSAVLDYTLHAEGMEIIQLTVGGQQWADTFVKVMA